MLSGEDMMFTTVTADPDPATAPFKQALTSLTTYGEYAEVHRTSTRQLLLKLGRELLFNCAKCRNISAIYANAV